MPKNCRQLRENGDESDQSSKTGVQAGAIKPSVKAVLASDDGVEQKPPAKPELDVPQELRNYAEFEIIKELGRGGMGVVYLAKNVPMDRIEVLKVLNERLLEHDVANRRFQNEIRSAAKLNHPNIVTSYSVLNLGELLVYSMEFVNGMDLHKFVRKHHPLPVALAASFGRQIASGLQHAHEQGLVHRDIKPSNVIVYRSEGQLRLKILDFGLAKATSENSDGGLTQDGMMLGTPEFVSPEQILEAAKADIRADIYSLGCTLYYMLSGKTPFHGTQGQVLLAHHNDEPKSLTVQRPEVPHELEACIFRMMAKEPAKRFTTPAAVYVALKPFLNDSLRALRTASGVEQAENRTIGDLQSSARDTSVEQVAPELSISLEHSIGTDKDAKQQISTMMAEHRNAQKVRKRARRKPLRFLRYAALIASVLSIALLGVFIIRRPDGKIIVENVPPNSEITVDGNDVAIIWNDGDDNAEVSAGEPIEGHLELRLDNDSQTESAIIGTFQAGSVWVGEGTTSTGGSFRVAMTVLTRTDKNFTAKFDLDGATRQSRIVSGKVIDDRIAWLAKDVEVIEGHQGHDHEGTVSEDQLRLNYAGIARWNNLPVEGQIELSLRKSGQPPID